MLSTGTKLFELPAGVVSSPETNSLIMHGVDIYKDIMKQLREQMLELVKSGAISEQTATRIILEQEYNNFTKIVALEYKKQEQVEKEQG